MKKKKTNLNDMARRITLKEGGKVNLPIAQVKEVMKLTFEELADMPIAMVAHILKRYR
ncbi:hypothetical protein LCGC14_2199610 [marine sediment metagenome]|uniref:Uncharacterized protein n=1 Tax=marine sediment metagenome TaxID=412755 RepID=A0A0F9DH28_9ZZZZ